MWWRRTTPLSSAGWAAAEHDGAEEPRSTIAKAAGSMEPPVGMESI
jgi:hypothetical protein